MRLYLIDLNKLVVLADETSHDGMCPICLGELTIYETPLEGQEELAVQDQDSMVVELLACGHQFHLGCLEEWTKRSLACPMCRYDIRKVPSD